ncbi:MAG: M48 family metallopeptidase [Flavobacteriales bacterium]
MKRIDAPLPSIVSDVYDAEKQLKFKAYFKEKSRFSFWSGGISFAASFLFFAFGGFGWLDDLLRYYIQDGTYLTLTYFGILIIVSDLIFIPFQWYFTFVIEEKHGFNRTTVKTFLTDKLKGYLITAALGGVLLFSLQHIYNYLQVDFWWLAWILVAGFMLISAMFYTSFILPFFNKLTPLPEGELKNQIEQYAREQGFSLKRIYVMDGSKRSSKANAFFSGLGGRKTIVLFDTLIEKLTTNEVVAVLAHEVGHYKLKHTLTGMFLGLLQTALLLYLLGYFLSDGALSFALGASEHSFHLGLIAFAFLFTPISLILGIITSFISRRNEFAADAFAKKTHSSIALASALKKLTIDSLGNVNPHPLNVFFHYSHPPLHTRLQAIED